MTVSPYELSVLANLEVEVTMKRAQDRRMVCAVTKNSRKREKQSSLRVRDGKPVMAR